VLSYFRYVRHADVPAFAVRGWAICGDLGPVHGHWSVLMRWTGPGEPA
jgi:hypothetical protein